MSGAGTNWKIAQIICRGRKVSPPKDKRVYTNQELQMAYDMGRVAAAYEKYVSECERVGLTPVEEGY